MRYYECYHHRQLQQTVWESQLWVQEPFFLPDTLISCRTLFQQFENFKFSQNILLLRRLIQVLAATPICYPHLFTAQFKV